MEGDSFSGDSDFAGHGHILIASGNRNTATYTSVACLGLAGHMAYDSAGNIGRTFYFDHGFFNAATNQFIVNSTNHVFTSAGASCQYPDFRQTEFDDSWVLSSVGGTSLPSQYEYPYDVYSSLENHYFGGNYCLFPNQTTKTVKILYSGNLAQSEKYVYTSHGASDGEGHYNNPQWTCLYKIRYSFDSLGRATNVVRIDAVSGQTLVLYTANYRGLTGHDGELLISETDEFGAQTQYIYNSLKQQKTLIYKGFGLQSDRVVNNTYDADSRSLNRTTTASGLSLSESWAFDSAGRLTNHVDERGISTQTSFSADNLTTTTLLPGSISTVQQNSIDRTVLSVQGNGCIAKFYENSTERYQTPGWSEMGGEQKRVQTIHFGHTGSNRWQKLGQGLNGDQGAWNEKPVGGGSSNTVWSLRWSVAGYGQPFVIFEEHSPDNPSMTYTLDPVGNSAYTGISVFTNQPVTPRVTRSATCYITLNGACYEAITNFIYLEDGDTTSGTGTVSSIHLEQMSGFGANQSAGAIELDADGNITTNITIVLRDSNQQTILSAKPHTSTQLATTVYQNGLPISSSTLSVANPTLYFYDALGRTNRIQSPLGYSAYINYDPATGWVTSQTDFTGQTTTYQYYNTNEANSGKLKCQTSANGKKTYYAYTTRGELYRTWGDVPYPAEYRYSEYDDLTNLITFRGGSGWTSSSWPGSPGTGDNTYWVYDEASGALLSKIDAQGHSVNYAYDTSTGRLLTRTWARMNGTNTVTVTNSYNGFGDLTAQGYNDGTPNVYFNNYNRAGQPREIIDGSGTNELAYDFARRLVTSSVNGGLLDGLTVSNHFNPYYGRDAVAVKGLSSALEDDYGYDSYGRLGSVSSGTNSATYVYVPNSDLLQSTTFKNSGSTVLTTARSWDYGMRLHSIANVVDSTPVTAHSYQYDALNRRTKATLEDGSFWQYGYDDRDELTSANRNWPTSPAPVSGQQFSYAYDTIGNRQSVGFGGDTNGANLRTITYTNNSLNQYVGITTPGYENIIGAALATNSVSVNGSAADRKGEYFHKELTVANSGGPVWQNVTNTSGTFTNKGGLVFPANGQALAYDADGNLSFDGIWNYQWDGENRLVVMWMTNVSGIANSNRLQLQFAYDYMGRRIQKVDSVWNGSAFVPQSTNRFVYDGWNLLATISPSSSIQQSFMWGNDLSGTEDQAGGIGGLLTVCITGTNCFVTHDGNGNITGLINATDKSLAARYEYSPYGELLRETGLLSRQNPFRFSTKYWDDESGLIYYNYRYYNPTTGKWISKGPSEEHGGINLYLFTGNSAINTVDSDGQANWLQSTFLKIATSFILQTTALQHGQLANDPFSNRGKQEVEVAKQREEEKVRRKGTGIGPGGIATTVFVLALVAADTTVEAAAAAAYVKSGGTGEGDNNLVGFFRNYDSNSAESDLDATMAALELGGYQADASSVAWGTLQAVGEVYDDLP